MRFVVLVIAGWGAIGAVRAQGAAELRDCIGARELQEMVYANRVVTPATAIQAARRQVPNAELVRGNLCRWENGLVYVIWALRRDGRLVKVTVDGPTGKVQPP